MKHFNGLTEAEAERLAILAEECAEVQQAVCKILRHGYESVNPLVPNSETNREALQRELGDLLCAIDRVAAAKDINTDKTYLVARTKRAKMARFLHHQSEGWELR